MKYLRKFLTTAEFDAYLNSSSYVRPNVSLIEETGMIMYDVVKGVFVQHVDGRLFTIDEWQSNGYSSSQANGVAVCSPEANFVIAKDDLPKAAWSSNQESLITAIGAVGNPKNDYSGAANTVAMIENGTSGAAHDCANYVFPNGLNGYLPSFGEFTIATKYKTKVIAAMSLIEGTAIQTTVTYWTSTQQSATQAWRAQFGTPSESSISKYNLLVLRPFQTLVL